MSTSEPLTTLRTRFAAKSDAPLETFMDEAIQQAKDLFHVKGQLGTIFDSLLDEHGAFRHTPIVDAIMADSTISAAFVRKRADLHELGTPSVPVTNQRILAATIPTVNDALRIGMPLVQNLLAQAKAENIPPLPIPPRIGRATLHIEAKALAAIPDRTPAPLKPKLPMNKQPIEVRILHAKKLMQQLMEHFPSGELPADSFLMTDPKWIGYMQEKRLQARDLGMTNPPSDLKLAQTFFEDPKRAPEFSIKLAALACNRPEYFKPYIGPSAMEAIPNYAQRIIEGKSADHQGPVSVSELKR